jgi:hypothetical protein
MMRAPLATCLLVILTSGCTHRHILAPAAGPEAFADANNATAGEQAEVLTRNGEVFRWQDVRFRPDSTFGIPLASGLGSVRPSVPTEQIATVTIRSRARGALEGIVIGAVTGAVLVGILGDPNCSFGCPRTRLELVGMAGVGGAGWGAIIGAIRASRTRIEVR